MKPYPSQAFAKKGGWASRLPFFLYIIFSLALPASLHAQTAPTLIPFQARLTNQGGDAYSSGQYTLTFNLYDQAVGGSTVWTERHEKVGIVNGMVNVFLGSIATFPTWQPGTTPQVALFTGTKYLGITVDADGNAATADPEMVPRTMLVNAFHAQNSSNLAGYNWSAILQGGSNNPQSGFLRADKLNPASITNAQITPLTINTASIADNAITTDKLADNAISAADLAAVVREALVPPGTILPFGGITAPTGFLMCDGTAYNRSGTYASLFTTISTSFGAPSGTTFNVPDLRGQFLRGATSNLTATCTGSATSNNFTVVVNSPATRHPFSRTGMQVRVTGANVAGLNGANDYYIINVSPTQVALASTPADAFSGIKISVSGSAVGLIIYQSEDPDASNRLAMATGGAIGDSVGSIQSDAFKSHTHTQGVGGAGNGWSNGIYWAQSTVNPYISGATGGSETRPKNVYVNYIIKY